MELERRVLSGGGCVQREEVVLVRRRLVPLDAHNRRTSIAAPRHGRRLLATAILFSNSPRALRRRSSTPRKKPRPRNTSDRRVLPHVTYVRDVSLYSSLFSPTLLWLRFAFSLPRLLHQQLASYVIYGWAARGDALYGAWRPSTNHARATGRKTERDGVTYARDRRRRLAPARTCRGGG